MKHASKPQSALYLLLSAAVFLTACGDKPKPEQTNPKVVVMEAVREEIPVAIVLNGNTKASAEAEIRPQVTGIVLKQNFTEGSRVTKGQSLYNIDTSTQRAAYDTANAALAKSQANFVTINQKAKRYES